MDEDYLIKKWLSNTLSEQEWKQFRKLDGYGLHIRLSEKAKNFKASDFLDASDYETLKRRIESRPIPVNGFYRYRFLLPLAAIFIVAIGIYIAFFSNNPTHIETLTGEKITVALPDASEVVLNAVTEITYDQKKWKEKRELTLLGEAYFSVKKGSDFDVLTSAGKVSVLGTQFNVKSRKGLFEVVCYQGSVGVTYGGKSEKLSTGHELRILNGEMFLDTILGSRPHWIKNISSFKNVPFYEVIHELERQYDIKINAKTVDIDRLFMGGFVHGDLDKALESITMPMDLTYVIQSPNRVVLKNSE